MDEAKWLQANMPHAMLVFVQETASPRKRYLTVCNLCRRVWHLIPVECTRFHGGDPNILYQLIEAVERHADGLESFWAVLGMSTYGTCNHRAVSAFTTAAKLDWKCSHLETVALWASASVAPSTEMVELPWHVPGRDDDIAGPAQLAEMAVQCNMLRDMFGNPFRRLCMESSVLTPTIISMAQGAYDERIMPVGHLDTQRLGTLADALEATGVEPKIMEHLREPGPHVRGCWAVDLVLGRT